MCRLWAGGPSFPLTPSTTAKRWSGTLRTVDALHVCHLLSPEQSGTSLPRA